jgi:4-hydroxybenzoate polyprenyltransferase
MAFFITMAREIIKDIEDIDGDKAHDYLTYPVVNGIPKSKTLVFAFIAICLIIIGLLYIQANNLIFYIYMSLTIIPIITYTLWLIRKADKKEDYKKISNWLKATMFLGLFSSLFC